MAGCTAKVTVTIADQDGIVLERFRVVDVVEPDPGGAKAAENVIGRRVREHVEDWFEVEDIVGPFDRPSPVEARHGFVDSKGEGDGDDDDDGYADDYDF